MKKWIMVCLTLMISIALGACNSASKENITTLQSEQNGVSMKFTYKAVGDKVIEQTANNVIPYESLGVTTPEEAEAILAEIVKGFEGVEGITHNMDYQDDKVIETLTLDYETADLNQVKELTGATFEGNIDKGISLKRSVEMLQQQGFEIVE